MNYKQVTDGEWVHINFENQKESCCHCGLVHRVSYKVRNKALYAKFEVDKRATGQMRRNKKLTT